jgi:hypothetical protein
MPNNASGCRTAQVAYGVTVTESLCGDRAVPLRVTAVSLDGRRHKVTIIYRVVG